MFQFVDVSWRHSICHQKLSSSHSIKVTLNKWKRNGNVSLKRNYSYGEEDPYRVLGINRNATKEEVRKAYRELAKKTHPDQNKGSTTKDFLRVKKAYEAINSGAAQQQQQQYQPYSSYGGSGSGTAKKSSGSGSYAYYGGSGGGTSSRDPFGQGDRERFERFYKEWDQNVRRQQAQDDFQFTQEDLRRKDKYNKNSYAHPGANWEEWLRHVDEINRDNERKRPKQNENWRAEVNRNNKTQSKYTSRSTNPYSTRNQVNFQELFQKYAEQMNINVRSGSIFDIIKGFFEMQRRAEDVVREANHLLPRNLKMIQTGKTVMLQGEGNKGGSVTLPPFDSPSAASVLFWANSILAQSRLISLEGATLKMRVTDNSNNLLGHFSMTRTATIPFLNIELAFKYVFHNSEGTIISRGRSYHFLNIFNFFKFERRGVTLAKMLQLPLVDDWKVNFHPSVATEATLYTFAMAYQMLGGITQRK